MIPAPNLDDRTFEDIVQEAITLIPKYCPGWTNHNPTDPGITLIELFSWMMEMVIYRLNKVTDKNYLAFLELMGISLQPAQPARALLQFALAPKSTGQRIEAGTQVATPQTGTQEAIVFETERDIQLTPVSLVRCFSQFKGDYTEHTDQVRPEGEGFMVFHGQKTVERVLYLGDDRFANLNEAAMLRLNFTAPETVGTDFPRFLEWQYWNGRRWKELMTSAMEFTRGEIIFDQIEGLEPCSVGGIQQFWIRGVLVEVPQSEDATLLDTVKAQIEIIGEGIDPDVVLTNDDMDNMLARDLSKNIAPFGDNPKVDCMLYMASHEFFGQSGSHLRIEFRISDPTVKEPPRPNEELVIAWEYYDGKAWRMMARATPAGLEESLQGLKFEDGTLAFSQSGSIAFQRPNDMAETDVNGQVTYWIRARIVQGNFGVPGQYELDGDRWVWLDANPLRPPYLKSLRINYSEESRALTHVQSYNDFHFVEHTDQARQPGRAFQPFQPVSEESPTLYMGFDEAFPNASIPLYIHNTTQGSNNDLQREFREHLQRHFATQTDERNNEQRVVWEYSNQRGQWSPLAVADQTLNFTQSGFVDFIGPKDMGQTRKFGHQQYWLRARLEMGGFIEPPLINYIGINCVYALNQQTLLDETLGSSEGTPNQHFEFNYRPVLENEQVWVRERERPSDRDLVDLVESLGSEDASLSDVMREPEDGRGGVWVRWMPVESFYASGQSSRHYKKDPILGKVVFGDGIRGMVPPIGESNVVARSYRVGGGARGNVGSNTITTLKRAISYIDAVNNPFPATGGSDQESVEAVKERGPYVIRSNYRAVTSEDFVWLAQQASNAVARAACLPATEREGEVQVVIIPKFDERNSDYREKLTPSTELLRRVRRYLDERRLVTTLVNVTRPRYVDISVRVDVIRKPTGSPDKMKRDIERALRVFLHPLRGGRNAKGWPFGRNVLKMDLYHVVEEVAGVEFVDRIKIVDEDQRIEVDQIKIGPDELPYLLDVEVTEKAREKII